MSERTTDKSLATLVLVVLGALLVLPLLFMGFGTMGSGGMMGGWEHGMWNGGGAPGWVVLLGAVIQLGFLAALVWLGYLVFRSVSDSSSGSERALEELRLAYARGDISDEEYENRRDRLERDS
ncbi:SHOCT domain-containing protein [Haloarchaeobius salinus]|uniref:SHOCT domain-containing protein n=1 Tax=Haloarchaeobius salinus TaxID=1198298 RepID=UPI00210EF276|nr:SHOCT domain-containing protein [Haloarchaeobius salinus]